MTGLRIIIVIATALSFAPPAAGAGDASECESQCRAELALARSATEKFRDVGLALAAGYVPVSECAESPAGAMGIHYANSLREPGTPDIASPDILLYLPDADGIQRLVALEYLVPVRVNGAEYFGTEPPPPDAEPHAAPVLFEHAFDGPMPGHLPIQGWHYDLHVWAWSENPRGTFAQYNPRASCHPLAPEPSGVDPIVIDDCHEFYVEIRVPYENASAHVPPGEYTPAEDVDGAALVALRASRCTFTIAGESVPTLMSQVSVLLKPPEESTSHLVHDGLCCDWYMLAVASDNPALNDWLRADTGMGDLVRDVKDIEYSFTPDAITGIDQSVRVRAPWPGDEWSFAFDAVAFLPREEAVGPPLLVNLWRDTPAGRVRLEGTNSHLKAGPATGTVTTHAGSTLALLLGGTSHDFASPIASNRLDGSTLTKEVQQV